MSATPSGVAPVRLGPVSLRWTQRQSGDFYFTARNVEQTRQLFMPGSWSWLEQVHGPDIVVVGDEPIRGAKADALVTNNPDAILSIATADCFSVALVGDNGVTGAAHAGWRGLNTGVLANTANVMREMGAERIQAVAGPAIGVECYEFDDAALTELEAKFDSSIRGVTSRNTPALDMRAALYVACEQADIELVAVDATCTACAKDDAGSPLYYSARARNEPQRFALVITK